jgi:ornithine carbamoyltransferase
LSKDEIIAILDLADELKKKNKQGIPFRPLAGKLLGMIFQKSSTRTRVSFEAGMYQLGGYPMFLSSGDLQIGRGEPVEDTARVLSRYLDGIMIRTFAQREVEDLAKYGTIPVINGLTDYAHPCQVLADLQTIREYKGGFAGLKMAYIGDGNNMANSLITGCLKVGMHVSCAIPDGYYPADDVLEFARGFEGFDISGNVMRAAEGADVLITDVWASMGHEEQVAARKKAFRNIQINADVMAAAHKDAIVQHCLPAHKGEEITKDVFEAHAAEIFDEAENRLHAQKAVMTMLMSGRS